MRKRAFLVLVAVVAGCGTFGAHDPGDSDAGPERDAAGAEGGARPDAEPFGRDASPDAGLDADRPPIEASCSVSLQPRCNCEQGPCVAHCPGGGDCYVKCPADGTQCDVFCSSPGGSQSVVCERGTCVAHDCAGCLEYPGKCR